ncbi:recombinase family protein [Carnobacterium maltaromaticum]|uniref:recombinase family protein n=1 Tax=Carnobacterium maltaromaticum TaxID=2751 RepID=UPI00191BB8BA|nr:recombinase family protein [Carnobacterium maltaromaticum]CAD5903223.1 DNA-invertase hin [Carnobacterium maltaromaticum]
MTKIIAYIRTSTSGQDLGLEAQRQAVELFSPDKIFSEQVSGRKENREELNKALKTLEKGDTLLIYNLSRLGRSSKQLVTIMSELNTKGIHLKSVQESIDTSTASGRLFYTMLAAIAEFEAENISQRTKDALAQTNKKLGRPAITPRKEQQILNLYDNMNLSLNQIAKKCNVSEKTIYNIAKKNGKTRRSS